MASVHRMWGSTWDPDEQSIAKASRLPARSSPKWAGFKGYGKGNFGRPLPVPKILEEAHSPLPVPVEDQHGRTPTMYAAGTVASDGWWPEGCPPPIKVTAQIVQERMAMLTPLTGLTARSGDMQLQPGAQVLWRGVCTGKQGGASTKEEYFNGTISAVVTESDTGDTLYHIS